MNEKSKRPTSEGELVKMFKSLFEPEHLPTDLLIGIGDDAAVFEPGVDPETKFVITTDMLVEDVHFVRNIHSFYDVGWRTATANISDIAAMGALPRWGVATIALPVDVTTSDIMDFARGLKDAMSEFDAYIVGGDLTKSKAGISVSMTLIGETTGAVKTRSGAELGDVIAVTGTLGDSRAGLELLLNPDAPVPQEIRDTLVSRHLKPKARVQDGQYFANNPGIHAMMDISDGIGIDLTRICEASLTGGRIFEEMLPISDEVRAVASLLGRDVLDFVSGGEDFELLVTGDREAVEYIAALTADESGLPGITIIGDIIDLPFGIHLGRTDGSVVNPRELGWDHFKK